MLLLLVVLYTQGISWAVVWAFPCAFVFDYLIEKISWISNTRAEKIYTALTTPARDHVHENVLEVWRRKHSGAAHTLICAMGLLPFVVYQFIDVELPSIFKFYYFSYLLIVNCSFAVLTYSKLDKNIDLSLTPLEFVRKYRMSRLYSPATIGGVTLTLIAPMLLVGWALFYGAPGLTIIHVCMAIYCVASVISIHQAEYNISIQKIAAGISAG